MGVIIQVVFQADSLQELTRRFLEADREINNSFAKWIWRFDEQSKKYVGTGQINLEPLFELNKKEV